MPFMHAIQFFLKIFIINRKKNLPHMEKDNEKCFGASNGTQFY